ncbi:MAG: hypothetical protein AAB382_11365 [Chloroflexota bacterium]
MVALSVSPQVAEYLGFVRGETPDEKVLALLESYLTSQLKECEREIGEYEVKYRSTFAEFAEAWLKDAILDKHSHSIERDYMEWEGLEAEKRRWLELLKRLPRNGHAEE